MVDISEKQFNFFFFLLQIEDNKLFSNIEEIYTINLAFWMANLSKVVENVSNFSRFLIAMLRKQISKVSM